MKKIATFLTIVTMAITASSQVVINGDINAPVTINQNYYGHNTHRVHAPIDFNFGLGAISQFSLTNGDEWFTCWKFMVDFQFGRYDMGFAVSFKRSGTYQGYRFGKYVTIGIYGGADWSKLNNPTTPIAISFDFGLYIKHRIGHHWEAIGEITSCNGLGIGFIYTF